MKGSRGGKSNTEAARAYRLKHPDRVREAGRRSRLKHKEERKRKNAAKWREAARLRMAELRAWISAIKLEGGCSLCGYRQHPAALDFDHLDPSKKSFAIGTGPRYTRAAILAEIAKCRILCANCHREETARKRSTQYRRAPDHDEPDLPLFEIGQVN